MHDRAAATLVAAVTALNQDIDRNQPWKAAIGDPNVVSLLQQWRDRLHSIGWWLQPFLPGIGAEIVRRLSAPRLEPGTALLPRLS